MTAATLERLPNFAGQMPSRGSYKIAANTLIRKGWIVGLDAAGRAVAGDTIANGCLKIVGTASSTIDNRTGSDLGGLADATDVYVEYGVFGMISKAGGGDDIAQANAGQAFYVVDNQTVALTSGAGARALGGLISEVRDGQVYGWMGPHVVGAMTTSEGQAQASQQSGSSVLVAGVSAAIAATIVAGSRIVATLKTPNTDALTVKYAALATDRVVGAPGSFKLSALTSTGGGDVNVADVSTLDWEVINPPI